MAHSKQMKRKYAPQANPYIKMKDQDVQENQPPIKKWKSTPLRKLRIIQSKLLQNPFAAKGSVKLADLSPQPELETVVI